MFAVAALASLIVSSVGFAEPPPPPAPDASKDESKAKPPADGKKSEAPAKKRRHQKPGAHEGDTDEYGIIYTK